MLLISQAAIVWLQYQHTVPLFSAYKNVEATESIGTKQTVKGDKTDSEGEQSRQ